MYSTHGKFAITEREVQNVDQKTFMAEPMIYHSSS